MSSRQRDSRASSSSSRHTQSANLSRTHIPNPGRFGGKALGWLIFALLLGASCGGFVLFGGVRIWSRGTLAFVAFLGISLTALRPILSGEDARLRFPPGFVFATIMLMYALVRVAFALVPGLAWIEWLSMAALLGLYWAWSEWAPPRGRWRIVFAVFLLLGSVLSWYALIQHAQGTRMVMMLQRPEGYGMRASATYMCPNHFANLLEILICVAVACVCMRGKSKIVRMIAGYGLILWKRGRKWFLIALVAIPVCLVAFGFIAWRFSPVMQERITGMDLSNPDTAVACRLMIWRDMPAMITDRTLLGHGGGSFRWAYPKFKTHNLQMWIRYTHNETLQFVSEYGVVGLLLLAAAVLSAIIAFMRAFARAEEQRDICLIAALAGSCTACFLHSMFDFVFHVFANIASLLLVAGVTQTC